MHYTDSFVWRGLTFTRIEKENPLIVYYLSGSWTVWTAVQLEGELERDRWWYAQWKGTQFRAKLLPHAQAYDWKKALDTCFERLERDLHKHAAEMEDMQRGLDVMLLERNEAIKSLLELVRKP